MLDISRESSTTQDGFFRESHIRQTIDFQCLFLFLKDYNVFATWLSLSFLKNHTPQYRFNIKDR